MNETQLSFYLSCSLPLHDIAVKKSICFKRIKIKSNLMFPKQPSINLYFSILKLAFLNSQQAAPVRLLSLIHI